MTAQQNQDHGSGIADHHHDAHERLIQRVLHSLGPANDAGQALNNISFAQRLVAALLELRLIHAAAEHNRAAHARSTEQDQPKNEEPQTPRVNHRPEGSQLTRPTSQKDDRKR